MTIEEVDRAGQRLTNRQRAIADLHLAGRKQYEICRQLDLLDGRVSETLQSPRVQTYIAAATALAANGLRGNLGAGLGAPRTTVVEPAVPSAEVTALAKDRIRGTRQAILSRRGVLRRLSAQADADMGDYTTRDDEGRVTGLKIPTGRTRQVRAVKLKTRVFRGPDGNPVEEREVELRVADPTPAAVALADIYGMRQGGGAPRDGAAEEAARRVAAIQALPEAVDALERLATMLTPRALVAGTNGG